MRTRPATLDDVAFLTDVVVEATRAQGRWPADLDESEFRHGFTAATSAHVRGAEPASTTSVIELDGEPIGRLRVVRHDHRIELAGIQLVPAVQGRGIGSRIIEELQAEATAAGVALELGVEHDNPRARALYERLGFVHVGDDTTEARLRWPRA